MVKKANKVAFTLAEVLITLGIIGVVAAMTLPTVITNVQEKATAAKLKKAYNTLENAYQRMISDYGSIDTWGLTGSKDEDYYKKDESGEFELDANGNKQLSDKAGDSKNLFAKRLFSYMKIIDNCEYGKCSRNVAEYYLNGTLKGTAAGTGIILADGISISGVWIGDSSCKINYGSTKALESGCGDLYVVLKPRAKTRTYGKDFFNFIVTKYGIIPSGTPQEKGNNGNLKNCLSGRSWSDCTAWVIYNENLDYIHCSDLSWDGKKRCK